MYRLLEYDISFCGDVIKVDGRGNVETPIACFLSMADEGFGQPEKTLHM